MWTFKNKKKHPDNSQVCSENAKNIVYPDWAIYYIRLYVSYNKFLWSAYNYLSLKNSDKIIGDTEL